MKESAKTLLRPFAILIVLAVLGAVLVTQVPIRADLAILLPERQSEELKLLHRALREGPANRTVMIAIRPGEVSQEESVPFERLATLSRALKTALQETGEFEQVANGSFALRSNALQPFLKHRYHLNPRLDPASFTAEGLGKALDRLLIELRSLGAPVIEEIMAADPTLRTLDVARLWRQSGGPRKEQGVWVGRDGTRAVLLVRSKREAFDAKDQTAVVKAIDGAIAKVEAEHGSVQTSVSGPSIIALESRQAAESESRRLLLWSVPVVVLILLVAFRRPTVLLASAVPLLGGFIAGTATVAVIFGEVLAPTLGFGAILVGVGVDYPLHLFGHRRPADSALATARRIWPSLLLGVATTAIGFLPLVFSSFPGVAQLGVFTIAGLAVAAAASRWLLPWVVQPITLPPAGRLWDIIAPLHRGLGRGRVAALLLGAAAIGVLAIQDDGLWQNDLRALSPIPEKTRQTDQALRQDVAATNPRYLLAIEGSDTQAVLARGEALLGPLRRLQEAGVLDGFELAARYLPSVNTQSAWLTALPTGGELRQRLSAALQGHPFRPNTFEPFVKDLTAAKGRGALQPDQIESPILRSRLETLMVDTDTGQRGFGFFEGLRDPGQLADAIAMADVPGVRLLDLKAETEALLAGYRDETLTWVGLGAALGLAVLILGLQRPGPVGRVGAAVVVSVLVTVAVLVLAGTALTLFHLLGLMVVAGLGLDYAIFLRNAVEDEKSSGGNAGRDGRRSVCVCAATSVSVFAILAGAQIPMLGQLGETVAVGAVLSLISAFVFTAAPGASRNLEPSTSGF